MTAQLAAERPNIKILIYTDDPSAITNGNKLLGLSSMIERLNAHAPTFAQISAKWVSRSSTHDTHADNKLNIVLEREVTETGAPFDEIWFFGLHQANTIGSLPGGLGGGPETELNAAEVEALTRWMRINEDGTGGIGVLMTGDHNNPPPPDRLGNGNQPAPTSEAALLGLGRALGLRVPRAGALRQWEGPPSAKPIDNLSTLASTGFQTDRKPQTLTHARFSAAGATDPTGQVHPLFFYRTEDELIDVFPDHGHEGLLVIPQAFDSKVWPNGPNGQPKPTVVAFGTDKRNGNPISILTAYDGDPANVGRIVADSSWHHYVNINLRGFPHPAPVPSDSDKIGQYYGNLAVWLAPKHKRLQMAQAMAWELAGYTLVLVHAEDESQLGDIADLILMRAAAPCEAHELVKLLGPSELRSESFTAMTASRRRTNPRKDLLGSVLTSYHEWMHATTQANTARTSAGTISRLAERSNGMACNGNSREWTITMTTDPKPDKSALDRILVFCLNNQNGIVTGNVSDEDGVFLSTVTGTHQTAFESTSIGVMALEFDWSGAGVELSGATLTTPETTFFQGRFRTNAPIPVNGNGHASSDIHAVTLEPGSGDTGSGSGQTT